MTLTKSSILFHFDAGYGRGVYPTVGGFPELTRSGAAFARNTHGTLIRLPASTPRTEPATIRGAVRPVMVLEAARTNELLASEDLANAAWTNTVTITSDDAVAPDGVLSADKSDDTVDTSIQDSRQDLTVADDGAEYTSSVYVKKRSGGPTVELGHTFFGGTSVAYRLQLDPATGDLATRSATPSDFGVIDLGEWWRLFLTGPNNASGNTSARFFLLPAINSSGADGTTDVAATGFNHFWGAQLEKAAALSSYIKTTTAAVSRAADDFRWQGQPQVQAMFIYADALWPGDTGVSEAWLAFAPDGSIDPRINIFKSTTDRLVVQHRGNNTDTIVQSDVARPAGVGFGDSVEVLALLFADGSVRVAGAGDGTVVSGTQSGPPENGIGTDYGDSIYVGQRADGSLRGVIAEARALIGKLGDLTTATDGTADEALLEEIRSFCNRITPSGEVR